MSDLIKKTILTGLGFVSLTKEKAEKLIDDLIKEGKVSKSEGSKLVKELLEKSEDNQKTIEKHVEKTVDSVLEKLNVPCKKDIIELNLKIEKLNLNIEKLDKELNNKK